MFLFIHIYIIPRMNNPDSVDTYCTVIGLYTRTGTRICDGAGESQMELDCVDIQVSYAISADSYGFGHLHYRDEHGTQSLQTNVTNNVCQYSYFSRVKNSVCI